MSPIVSVFKMLEIAKTKKYCEKHLHLMPNAYQKSIHSYSTLVQFIINLYILVHKIEKQEFPGILLKIPFNPYPHAWIQCTSTSSIYAYMTIVYNMKIKLADGILNHYISEIDSHFGKFNKQDSEHDLRFIYCCVASLELIKRVDPAFKSSVQSVLKKHEEFTIKYIHGCQDHSGAYGNQINKIILEPHAGYTYCAVAALEILNAKPNKKQRLLRWLVQRQQSDGGMQGRINKPTDTCYTFWIAGSLHILKSVHFLSFPKLQDFMVSSQSAMGGFGKTVEQFPDPLHSYLGTAGYLIILKSSLIDPVLNVFQ